MSPVRRYAPFAQLVAAQIVLVLVAPSRSSSSTTALGGQFPVGAQAPGTGQTGTQPLPPGASSAPVGGNPNLPSTGSGAPSTGTAPAGARTGSGRTGGATLPASSAQAARTRGVLGPVTGPTTGKPFCLGGLAEHPPCVGQWAGGSNGGATWQGVTATSIRILMYRPKSNAAVDAILRSTGTYVAPAAEKEQFLVVTDWLNKHDQLYGRKIDPVYIQGNCDIAPPVDSCFRNDADSLVAKYHPFAVFYDSDTNEPAFFDELSRKGVVNWGGWAFADSFNDNLRPYHYDLVMGGDVQAEFAGTWYCRRLAGHKAKYAGDSTLRLQTRKVVVAYPDTPETTPAAQHLMSIIAKCAGANGVLDGKYSSNTATATLQARTNTAKYKNEGATSILWFSDPIAPAYGTTAQAAQNWHPEEIVAGNDLVDYDALAQTYNASEWSHAFGISDLGQTVPVTKEDCDRIWKAEGKKGDANASTQLGTTYELAIAEGITAAGTKLTPLTFEAGLLNAPGYDQWAKWHDPSLVYIQYGRGDYTGVSDVREVYFDESKPSPLNGRNGTYVALSGGQRYQLNELPSGDPQLPAGV
jgi:hypothetical protein